ncbi:MAG: dihydroorotase [Planctomycetaceae bacterium]|nr:dihydroorotase [Planctomycetaceae bacterium]
MRTLIQNATVVFPEKTRVATILLDGHRIAEVDPPADTSADEVVDATGLHLLPGVIDDQVHFREPGLEHKEDLQTGSWACAKGGITTFFEMPNTNPTTTTLEALEDKLQRAASKCVVNYGFYVGATGDNLSVLQAAKRTPGIKIFIGSSTGPLLVDKQSALESIFAETDLPICAHCEDETTVRANQKRIGDNPTQADHSRIRDHAAALISTKRAVDLAIRHRHQFHVLHVSTGDEVDFLRSRPDWVSAEACPHHLFFHVDDYERLGSRVQMNPSIKTADDNARIWQGLRDGTIEVIATDHAPHTLDEKAQPYPKSPSGLPAVENSLALMLDAAHRGVCTLREVVAWMCESPARIWHVANKGAIRVGYDADLVLVDLEKRQTIRDEEQLTKSRWSPWDGVTLTGWPVRTWVMGQTAFQDGSVNTDCRGREAEFRREVHAV